MAVRALGRKRSVSRQDGTRPLGRGEYATDAWRWRARADCCSSASLRILVWRWHLGPSIVSAFGLRDLVAAKQHRATPRPKTRDQRQQLTDQNVQNHRTANAKLDEHRLRLRRSCLRRTPSTSIPINRVIVGDGRLTIGLVGSPAQRERHAETSTASSSR